jgi:hypothetical protein
MGGSVHDHLFLAADDRFSEGEVLFDAEVAAPAGTATAAPLRAAPSEELRKKVLELREDVAHPRARKVESARLDPRVAELVVAGPLLTIRKNAECLGGLLELGGGGGIVLVAVGVKLEGALTIALPNLVFGSLSAHPQDFVVAALFAHKVKNLGRS